MRCADPVLLGEHSAWCPLFPHMQPDMLFCQGLIGTNREETAMFTDIVLEAVPIPALDPPSDPNHVVVVNGNVL